MVGAGGTASHLIHPLFQYALMPNPESTLHIYDEDKVEDKNLSRQLFWPTDIGKNKVDALAERFNTHQVVPHSEYIGLNDSAVPPRAAVQNGDTVFICADNMFVRGLINEHAKTLDDVIIINGGNEEHTGSVQVFMRQKGKNITPSLDFNSPEFSNHEDPDISELSCAEIANLPGGEQTVIANFSVAALMLQALHRVWNSAYGNGDTQWTKQTFDFQTGTVQTSDVRLIGGLDA